VKLTTQFFCEVLVVGGAVLVLVFCLFAASPTAYAPHFFRPVAMDLGAVFHYTSIQWMMFACLGNYFVFFKIFTPNRSDLCFWQISNSSFWQSILIAVISLNFFFASINTQALAVIFNAACGCGALVWRDWHPNKSDRVLVKVIGIVIVLLVAGTLINPESLLDFQYLDKQRWAGLWDNPNTFGMLMGVGLALAVGMIARSFNLMKKNSGDRIQKSEVVRWVKIILFVAATGVMLFGLLKSYSRGAWLGAGIGIRFLFWNSKRFDTHLPPALSPRPTGGVGEERSHSSFISRFKRNRLFVSMVLVAILVLAVWNFRHTNHSTVRRAFSVANANDFSWRKRLSAYEGSLQMIADKPWFGFGWNQPESVYDKFYRKPKVDEGMAIQMNDYFTLGTTLGIPALVCFMAAQFLFCKMF